MSYLSNTFLVLSQDSWKAKERLLKLILFEDTNFIKDYWLVEWNHKKRVNYQASNKACFLVKKFDQEWSEKLLCKSQQRKTMKRGNPKSRQCARKSCAIGFGLTSDWLKICCWTYWAIILLSGGVALLITKNNRKNTNEVKWVADLKEIRLQSLRKKFEQDLQRMSLETIERLLFQGLKLRHGDMLRKQII